MPRVRQRIMASCSSVDSIAPRVMTVHMGRIARLSIALVMCVLLLAGCAGVSTAGSTTTAPTDTPPPPATTATTAPSTGPTASAAVTIEDFDFSPDTLSVKVGTTVTWTYVTGGTHHTVTSDTGAFHSGALTPGGKYSFTFNQAGTYPYHCSVHPDMTGQIVVTA